jgi:membrane protease YdiL (CAAX protease family)
MTAAALEGWLLVRPTWAGVVALVLGMWTIEVAIGGLIGAVAWLGVQLPPRSGQLDKLLAEGGLWKVLGIMLFAVVIEEAVFRLLPLSLGMRIADGRYVLVFAAVASLAFGLVHITNHTSVTSFGVVISILSQGVGGFLMSLLFLKYCGMNPRNMPGAFLVVIAVHFAWNATLITLTVMLKDAAGVEV